jgi:class 3 adenylate cyclase
MSELVQTLAAYVPLRVARAALEGTPPPTQAKAERLQGAVLFADISGFTPLTAALARELGLRRGAEELTWLLNEVYGVLIAEVHRYGGSVIGFSGDAITCWLDGDSGQRAVACALAMQGAMAPFVSVQTPAGTPVSLAIKVAVAAGPVRRFLVGDPGVQNVEVVAGRTLERLADAEHQANPGEVVATADVVVQTGMQVRVSEWRVARETGRRFAVVAELEGDVPSLVVAGGTRAGDQRHQAVPGRTPAGGGLVPPLRWHRL